ncbi:hypothetical protein KUCAC02_010484, partial [Chaenocephalus aceratus]
MAAVGAPEVITQLESAAKVFNETSKVDYVLFQAATAVMEGGGAGVDPSGEEQHRVTAGLPPHLRLQRAQTRLMQTLACSILTALLSEFSSSSKTSSIGLSMEFHGSVKRLFQVIS